MLDYEFVHTIDKVTQEFIDFLQQPLEIRLFVRDPPFLPPPLAHTAPWLSSHLDHS